MKKINSIVLSIVLALSLLLSGCSTSQTNLETGDTTPHISTENTPSPNLETTPEPNTDAKLVLTLNDIPAFSDKAYIAINGNVPFFTEADYTTTSFESYADLDSLGRCGVAYANIGLDLMPTEGRGSIGQVKPTGWHTVKYDNVDGKYLYNRCHLIGFQLTAENANVKNLITGTRYLNIEGMLPFENMTADYIKETKNHVLYRVTPIYEGDNLVAAGVLMEGFSVEDRGEGVCFNVFCYNAQPGISIDYTTGDSSLIATTAPSAPPASSEVSGNQETAQHEYVLNTKTHKFHYPTCSSVSSMKEANNAYFTGSREDVIAQGYEPCGRCKP